MKLLEQPEAPKGVKYALTVPQSVLFADLSLRGNRKPVFKEVFRIDYEPAYIAIDVGGAMSWNYDNDDDLNETLLGKGSTAGAIKSFIELMDTTTKSLNEVSKHIGTSKSDDLLSSLNIYWNAYERHMTSLFTFWNVERMLSDTLTAELKKAGRQNEIDDGLARYLKPDKPNYFVKERLALKKLTEKFRVTPSTTLKNAPKALIDALKTHNDTYDFLLAPFNLDNPMSLEDLLERAKEAAEEPALTPGIPDSFADLSPDLRKLAVLAQRFTFWKNERLDMFSIADSRVKELYKKAASAISVQPNDLFAMTRDEITKSLQSGKARADKDTLKQRQKSYCLILADGKIGFYEPSTEISSKREDQDVYEVKGVAASAGLASGQVRLIKILKDAKALKPGEIIVTVMTRPEMGMALDRAAAFVTDEGGMLCHAAIISREMKKPCVIATGNATKLLKNGQKIEVDGTEGVVKILAD